MKLHYLLAITQENGFWKGKELTEEAFDQMISREIKKKEREERTKKYEEKHPLISELEKEVKEYNENRGMYEEMLDEEDFLEDFQKEYGEHWDIVWKKEKERRLKKELYSTVDDENDAYQLRMFVYNHLLTLKQREMLEECQVKLKELLEEKNGLYEQFRKEWNERLGEEYFLPKEENQEKLLSIKKPTHVLEDGDIQRIMGITYEKHQLICLFEQEYKNLIKKYKKEEVENYLETTFKDTYGQAWMKAKEIERKRVLKIEYHRYSSDIEGKQYFIYTHLFTKEQENYLKKFGTNLEEIMVEKGKLYKKLKEEWEQELGEKLH
jgi:hypothetical protein